MSPLNGTFPEILDIKEHERNNTIIAEVVSGQLFIKSVEDGIRLLGDLYYQHFDSIILYEHHIAAEFFDLSTGMSVELLQKSANFRVPIAIVGDFQKYSEERMQDFIQTNNMKRQISFVSSVSEGIGALS